MLFKEAISKRIMELCSERNITANKLAETSTIPPSTLRDIINCNVENPSSMVIFQICKTLNIPIYDFYKSELFDFSNIDE